jgi:hypothetical protein
MTATRATIKETVLLMQLSRVLCVARSVLERATLKALARALPASVEVDAPRASCAQAENALLLTLPAALSASTAPKGLVWRMH